MRSRRLRRLSPEIRPAAEKLSTQRPLDRIRGAKPCMATGLNGDYDMPKMFIAGNNAGHSPSLSR